MKNNNDLLPNRCRNEILMTTLFPIYIQYVSNSIGTESSVADTRKSILPYWDGFSEL